MYKEKFEEIYEPLDENYTRFVERVFQHVPFNEANATLAMEICAYCDAYLFYSGVEKYLDEHPDASLEEIDQFCENEGPTGLPLNEDFLRELREDGVID